MCVKQDNPRNRLFRCLDLALSFTDKSIKFSVFLDVRVIDALVSAHLFRLLLFRWRRFDAEREEMEDDDQENREKVVHQVGK